MSAVAKRYARAAVEAASKEGGQRAVESLAEALVAFSHAYGASSELRELLQNPALAKGRQGALEAVTQKLGMSSTASRLVQLLAENDRIAELDEVAQEAQSLADEQAGRVRAHVSTAVALTDKQRERLARGLEKRFGHPVVLEVHVDDHLLGGIIVKIGDVTLDSSVRKQLTLLRERLLS